MQCRKSGSTDAVRLAQSTLEKNAYIRGQNGSSIGCQETDQTGKEGSDPAGEEGSEEKSRWRWTQVKREEVRRQTTHPMALITLLSDTSCSLASRTGPCILVPFVASSVGSYTAPRSALVPNLDMHFLTTTRSIDHLAFTFPYDLVYPSYF